MSELILKNENPMNLVPADKVLKKTRLDLQKRFPIYHVVSQMLGGPSLRLGIPRERLSIPAGFLKRWEKRRLTGSVG